MQLQGNKSNRDLGFTEPANVSAAFDRTRTDETPQLAQTPKHFENRAVTTCTTSRFKTLRCTKDQFTPGSVFPKVYVN